MTTTSPTPDALRSVNLRVTGPRVAILDALATRPHSDAETVLRAVREEYGKVSTQTVYDALHAMTSHGLIRRIEPAGQPALYERRVGDNHHHLVCRRCAMIVDIPCAVGYTPCLTAGHESELSEGFDIDEAEVTYWGICAACREAQANEEQQTHDVTTSGAPQHA